MEKKSPKKANKGIFVMTGETSTGKSKPFSPMLALIPPKEVIKTANDPLSPYKERKRKDL